MHTAVNVPSLRIYVIALGLVFSAEDDLVNFLFHLVSQLIPGYLIGDSSYNYGVFGANSVNVITPDASLQDSDPVGLEF